MLLTTTDIRAKFGFRWMERKKKHQNRAIEHRCGVGNHETKLHFMIVERTDILKLTLLITNSDDHKFMYSFIENSKCVHMRLRWRCQRTDREWNR